MTAQINQIVKAYEEFHLPISEIAVEHNLSEVEVKIALAQFSRMYRDDAEKNESDEEIGFSDQDHKLATQVITNLALGSDDDNLRFRAAKYIRQDKKGRLDGMKGLRDLNINVMAFNEQIRRMYESSEKSIKDVTPNKKALEV